MNKPVRNMLVGIFILSAIAILVGMIMFLKPSVGDGKQIVYVRFSDIGSISMGTRVLFAGKPVGEVIGIQEIPEAREQPTDELGRVYFYQLTLSIDSNVKIYNTDEITIQTSGLLGEKSIAIIAKSPPKGVQPRLITGQPIYADSVDPFQSAVVDFSDLAANMEEAFGQITLWIRQNSTALTAAIQSTQSAMDQIAKVASNINEVGLIPDIKQAVLSLTTTSDTLNRGLHELEKGDAFTNLAFTIENLRSASHAIDIATTSIVEGKGTIGKLFMEDDLYNDLQTTLAKGTLLLSDINQYGLLFHLNKQWQRERFRRIQLSHCLDSPRCLQTYFQQEVRSVDRSMATLSSLLERAELLPEKEQIFETKEFSQSFQELLHKVNQLSDNLKIYYSQFKPGT